MILFNRLERAVSCFNATRDVARFDVTGRDVESLRAKVGTTMFESVPWLSSTQSKISVREIGAPYRDPLTIMTIGTYYYRKTFEFCGHEMVSSPPLPLELPIPQLEGVLGQPRLPEIHDATIVSLCRKKRRETHPSVSAFFESIERIQQTGSDFRLNHTFQQRSEDDILYDEAIFVGTRVYVNIFFAGLLNDYSRDSKGEMFAKEGTVRVSLRYEDDKRSLKGWKVLDEGMRQFMEPLVTKNKMIWMKTDLIRPKELVYKIV